MFSRGKKKQPVDLDLGRVLVAVLAELKTVSSGLRVLEGKVERRREEDRDLGLLYRDCINRVTEVALGMSGHTELAERFRAHSGAVERATTGDTTTLEPMTWENDEDAWPPKGCSEVISRG